MRRSLESVVRDFLASWSDPRADRLGEFLAKDAVWVDGPAGVHRGAASIVDELVRQLTIARDSWLEIDTLVSDGNGIVMVEWHGGFTIHGAPIASKVMAVFEVDQSGRISQMRESYDMQSLMDQIVKASDPRVGAPGSPI